MSAAPVLATMSPDPQMTRRPSMPDLDWNVTDRPGKHVAAGAFGRDIGSFVITRSHFGRTVYTCTLNGLIIAKARTLAECQRMVWHWYCVVWQSMQEVRRLPPEVAALLRDAEALGARAAALAAGGSQ